MKITIFSGSFLDFHHFCQSFSPRSAKSADIPSFYKIAMKTPQKRAKIKVLTIKRRRFS